MTRAVAWLCAISWFCAAVAFAQQPPPPDKWHYVTLDSPFHTSERAQLHSAGIIQSDGRIALMVLGSEDQGALVSVNLPGTEMEPQLTSTLVMSNGTVLARTVKGDQLVATTAPDSSSVTYSFRVAPGDLESFMAARTWRISAGQNEAIISLLGSRSAISTALEARDQASDLVSVSE